ncbi:hypothetical protein JW905_17625 [bacterium]|nr:hypothetical protein [candidate division CSSED10-310 bacterium]
MMLQRSHGTGLAGWVLLLGLTIVAGCDRGASPTAPEMGEPSAAMLAGMDGRGIGTGSAIGSEVSRGGFGMASRYVETFIDRATGGTLNFHQGRLLVPPLSIDQSALLWARTYMVQGWGYGNILKHIYEFGPSGTTFDPPATLVLSYCDMGPIMPDSLDLMYFNEATGAWELASHMIHDPAARTFTGPISHFSRYSLAANGQTLRPQ